MLFDDNPGSYTVQWTTVRGPHVVKTSWRPGYTPAHKATAEEAVSVAIHRKMKQIDDLNKELAALNKLRNEMN